MELLSLWKQPKRLASNRFLALRYASATSHCCSTWNRHAASDLKLLADHDRSLDLVGGMEILPFADRLAKEVPSLRIIIDHLAGVVVDGKPSDLGGLRHIGLDRQGAAANPLNLPANCLGLGLPVLKVYSHIGTGLGQGQSGRTPDAPAAARDKGYFLSQFVFHIPR